MTSRPVPIEPDYLECEVCMKELANPASYSQEADDYVQHFCGIECYTKWKTKHEQPLEDCTCEDTE
ncbi:MAG: DUF3330 domain-containing protein [Thiohalomonadales bacterium]